MRGDLHYRVLRPITKPIFNHLFNVRFVKNELPAVGVPYILVGHHVSAMDPILINGWNHSLVRFLYTQSNKALKVRSYFLNHLDMIPFFKNSADLKSIRAIKKVLAQNVGVGIYPEGEATWTGYTGGFNPSIIKLIKMMKVDVYCVDYRGAYLSKPRWCNKTRKGKIEMSTYKLFSKEEVKSKSVDELYQELKNALDYNEFDWQTKAMIAFKGKNLAEYIERVLYYCPDCGKYNTFTSKGDEFYCTACGSRYHYDVYGQIHRLDHRKSSFKNVSEWYKEEYHQLTQALASKSMGEVINHNHQVIQGLTVFKNHEKTDIAIRIIEDQLEFLEESITLRVKPEIMRSFSVNLSYVIEFMVKKDFYRLEFQRDSSVAIKLFSDMILYIKSKNSKQGE